MARANTATLDGLTVGYGARDTINPQSATVHTKGNLDREVLFVIDSANYLEFATGTAVDGSWGVIPAGAVVRGVRAYVAEAFDALTSIVVGTKETDGTTIDDDGLIASTLLAALTLDATIEGAGAQVDGAVLSADAVPSMDVTGSAPTVGELHVYVQYDMPNVDQDSPAVITGEI